jgi:preprotein translocase subunit SecE
MKMFQGAQRFLKSIGTFLAQVRSELRKVVWPSPGQVRIYTIVVVATIVGIGAILWGTDALMAFGLGRVLGQ